jgi:SAM-dependent methyltransferase
MYRRMPPRRWRMSNWDTLAELDPLWTILSDPEKKFGKWDPAEFFGTGELEAKRVLAMCRSNGVNVSYGKLLDFGCGVGRMTRAFSGFFESCTGIDVSEKMISLAKKYNSERPNCDFVASSSERLPFPDQSFDFVFTVLVLQHVSRKTTILQYIGEFIRVVKDKGIVVFHLPNKVPFRRRIQLRRRLWSWLSFIGVPETWLFSRLGLAPILMNGISWHEVERFVRAKGATLQATERFDLNEGSYYSYYYIVTK